MRPSGQLADQRVPGRVEERFHRDLARVAETWVDRSIALAGQPTDGRHW